MTVTIGLVANVYNEVNALPGWLETHLPYFDDVRVLHAGPRGEWSCDGTIELLERWHVPMMFGSIDVGFGECRTQAIRWSPCDYVMLLDADERFYHTQQFLTCIGNPTPQHEVDEILRSYDPRDTRRELDWNLIGRLGASLRVEAGMPYPHGAILREVLSVERPDVVATIRRHWHDFSFRRPTQHWALEPDWQMRIIRNDPAIRFDPATRMHERLVGAVSVHRADMKYGPFFDHFHFAFKRQEGIQRAHDVAIYDCLSEGREPPTWREFSSKVLEG